MKKSLIGKIKYKLAIPVAAAIIFAMPAASFANTAESEERVLLASEETEGSDDLQTDAPDPEPEGQPEETAAEEAKDLSGEPAEDPSEEEAEDPSGEPAQEDGDEEAEEAPEEPDDEIPSEPYEDPSDDPGEETILPAVPQEALNAYNKTVRISDEVLERILSGDIILQEIEEENLTGIRLINSVTGVPVDPETGIDFERAKNADGELTVISAKVLKKMKNGIVVKGEDEYLYSVDKKYYVDPVTGEKYRETASGTDDGAYVPEEQELEELEEEGSNEDLIRSVTIVTPPRIEEDYRFFTVARVYAFTKEETAVKEGKRPDAREIGQLSKYNVCFILEDLNDGWLYVESGRVRGFIPKDAVMTKETDRKNTDFRIHMSVLRQQLYGSIDDLYAKELVPYGENAAFSYTRTTTGVTIAGKRCSLAKSDGTNIYEFTSETSRVIGSLPKNGRCYVLKSAGDGWLFVESGEARGFVKKNALRQYDDSAVVKFIAKAGEDNLPLASVYVSQKDNQSLWYSTASTVAAAKNGHIRKAMIEFASQFLGNPYVWGGTSLTEGCDCSGFCQQIYAAFGFSIPRVSRDQAYAGLKIPVEEALPGDLIFYARNGQIFHVAMSTGNGGTIEAMNSQNGIVNSTVAADYAVWAVRIIDDDADSVSYSADPTPVSEDAYGESLGTFTVSAYSPNRDQDVPYTGASEVGAVLRQGNIAVTDPEIIPYGTHFILNGCEYISTDCGVKAEGKNIYLFTNNALEKKTVGTYRAEVFAVKTAG